MKRLILLAAVLTACSQTATISPQALPQPTPAAETLPTCQTLTVTVRADGGWLIVPTEDKALIRLVHKEDDKWVPFGTTALGQWVEVQGIAYAQDPELPFYVQEDDGGRYVTCDGRNG